MIFPSNRVRILVATKPVDFRKGHDGLAALVKNELRKDPFTGTVDENSHKIERGAACSFSPIGVTRSWSCSTRPRTNRSPTASCNCRNPRKSCGRTVAEAFTSMWTRHRRFSVPDGCSSVYFSGSNGEGGVAVAAHRFARAAFCAKTIIILEYCYQLFLTMRRWLGCCKG